jgi:hypothetical protein
MTIQLSADIEAAIVNQAARLGTTPEQFVEQALRERLQTAKQPQTGPQIEGKLHRLIAVARPCGVALSNDALSSEGLYD